VIYINHSEVIKTVYLFLDIEKEYHVEMCSNSLKIIEVDNV
jgi:hypothetical protein